LATAFLLAPLVKSLGKKTNMGEASGSNPDESKGLFVLNASEGQKALGKNPPSAEQGVFDPLREAEGFPTHKEEYQPIFIAKKPIVIS